MTSAERRDPTAMSAGNEQEAKRHTEVLMLRKHATSADTIGEQEPKWTRSPRPSVASPVSTPPVAGAAEQARRSEERACTRTSSGPVIVHDSQQTDAPPNASVRVSRAEGS